MAKFQAKIPEDVMKASIALREEKIKELQEQIDEMKGEITRLKADIKQWRQRMAEDYPTKEDDKK